MENKNMDKQKNNLIRSLSIVIVIVWLFIVIINATLSFTEGVAFIDHCLVWSTLSLAFSLFALRVAGKDRDEMIFSDNCYSLRLSLYT